MARLSAYLHARGLPICLTCNPGGTALGQALRALLLETRQSVPSCATATATASLATQQAFVALPPTPMAELLLYMADRAQHTEAILKPALAQGAWVLCDRYADSTLAYQGAGRGMDPAMIAQINTWVTQGIVPDKTFLLDAPPALLRGRREARSAADRLEAEGLDFHQRVRAGFLDLARAHPQRIVVIDAGQPEEAVFLQILSTYNWGV